MAFTRTFPDLFSISAEFPPKISLEISKKKWFRYTYFSICTEHLQEVILRTISDASAGLEFLHGLLQQLSQGILQNFSELYFVDSSRMFFRNLVNDFIRNYSRHFSLNSNWSVSYNSPKNSSRKISRSFSRYSPGFPSETPLMITSELFLIISFFKNFYRTVSRSCFSKDCTINFSLDLLGLLLGILPKKSSETDQESRQKFLLEFIQILLPDLFFGVLQEKLKKFFLDLLQSIPRISRHCFRDSFEKFDFFRDIF